MSTLGYDPEFDKGEDMFKDLALSRDLMDEFTSKCSKSNIDTKGLSVNVLQCSGWPITRRKEGETDIELPSDVINGFFHAFSKLKVLTDARYSGEIHRVL